MTSQITMTVLPDFPLVKPGDDIAGLILDAAQRAGIELADGDVLAVAQKIVSKAEGRLVNLSQVAPGARAQEVAAATAKDPRVVELILRESDEISRMRPGVLIVRHRLGFTSANAGIDRSNVAQEGEDETVLLLPVDPDASAKAIRQEVSRRTGHVVAVLITDSHGRPFRLGTVGVAIGTAGMPALWDRRGESDLFGYALQHTEVAVADEIAAAAGLLMGQAAEAAPVILVRGLALPQQDGSAADLLRSKEKDLYR